MVPLTCICCIVTHGTMCVLWHSTMCVYVVGRNSDIKSIKTHTCTLYYCDCFPLPLLQMSCVYGDECCHSHNSKYLLVNLVNPPPQNGEGVKGMQFVRQSVRPSVTFRVRSITYARIDGLPSNLVQMLSLLRRCDPDPYIKG